jgi:hypothetical protein
LVTSHPVGNDEQVVLLEYDVRIFVVLPLEPHVAKTGCDRAHHVDSTLWMRLAGIFEGVKEVIPP